MAAQPPPRAVLRSTTQMSLNERFTALLKNPGPRTVTIRPSGWQRPPADRYLRRRSSAAVGGGRDLSRTVLKGGRVSPQGLRSPAQSLVMKGPHQRSRLGARARGRSRGRGQGISPLNRPQLTKEQLDHELDAYMAMHKARECLDADLDAYMAQPAPEEGLDADLDAYMADAAAPDTPTQTDPEDTQTALSAGGPGLEGPRNHVDSARTYL